MTSSTDLPRRGYPNMDIVRYLLAITVVVVHMSELTGASLWQEVEIAGERLIGGVVGGFLWWPLSTYNAVGGFFALSGFLVYGGYMKRRDMRRYLRARAYRIFPAYTVVVLAAAVGLVAVSTLTPGEYFSSGGFWAYLAANLTFLNFLHPSLPGVFQGPEFVMDAVNGSLWTLKVEWALYLSVPVVVWIITKLKGVTRDAVLVAILVVSIAYRLVMSIMSEGAESPIFEIMSRQFLGQLCYFYMGVLLYFHRDWLTAQWRWLLPVTLLVALAEPLVPYADIVVGPVWVSTLVILASIVGRWGEWAASPDNVSYDMYLWHFPIIQLGVALGIKNLAPGWGLLIVLALTFAISMLSWRFIGRYFLNLRVRKDNQQ